MNEQSEVQEPPTPAELWDKSRSSMIVALLTTFVTVFASGMFAVSLAESWEVEITMVILATVGISLTSAIFRWLKYRQAADNFRACHHHP
mgnify:FL=1